MKDIEIYKLDDLKTEREFGMDVTQCQHPGHFKGNVSLEHVVLEPNTTFHPHHHEQSDALVLILSGHGYIIDDSGKRYPIKERNLAYFPARTRHGFITKEVPLHFISVQSPPLRDLKTGHIDFIQ